MCLRQIGLTVLFIFGITFLIPRVLVACELTFATPTLKPHFWVENVIPKGIVKDFFDQVSIKTGCAIQYRQTPWKRVVREIEHGKTDFTIGFYNQDRRRFARYTQKPYGQNRFFLFGQKQQGKYRGLEDFFKKGQKLLYPTGWWTGSLGKIVERHKEHVINAPLPKGVELLSRGRGQALLGPEKSTLYEIVQQGHNKIISIKSPPLLSFDQYVFFSRASVSEDVFLIMEAAIDRLIGLNVLREVENKYTTAVISGIEKPNSKALSGG